MDFNSSLIKAIIGLGNCGKSYEKTRHNIGFRIVDEIACSKNSSFKKIERFEISTISHSNQHTILLIKPQTFMNNSGDVCSLLKKKCIKPEEIVVCYDELEKTFGKILLSFGGSARGHNGIKSIIQNIGDQFWRLRFGIGRPESREDVSKYVLSNFYESEENQIQSLLQNILEMLELH